MCVHERRSVSHTERIDMFLKQVTNCLLFLTLICLLHTDAESIRADEGATVHLPCHSPPDDSEKVSVKWTKNSATSETICEWIIQKNIGSSSNGCIPRFTFNRTSFTLSIEKLQPNDSGNYSCKITRLIPPPTFDNISNVILHVAAHPGLSLQLLNSSDDTCVHLLCSLESLNPELVNFTWSRGQMSLHPSTSYDMKSELDLCKPDWSDGDMITCHASYSNSQTQISIQLPASDKAKQLIIICSAAAGLILCIIIIIIVVVLCKCRKRDENGSIVFSNKVYENFSFAMSRQNAQSIAKAQTEECIYEN
ncbi:cell surface A33 antigen-like [Chanodichthys erythropterus]|uniref:cell surface A33 antigen-like n=1 Tax=Chanodichthys erythropterus TaxID=933992 RepID=UPI00351EA1BF